MTVSILVVDDGPMSRSCSARAFAVSGHRKRSSTEHEQPSVGIGVLPYEAEWDVRLRLLIGHDQPLDPDELSFAERG